MRLALLALALSAVAQPLHCGSPVAEAATRTRLDPPRSIGGVRQLFADASLLAELSGGARLAMQRPVKQPGRVLRVDSPWERDAVGGIEYHLSNAVLREGGQTRLYTSRKNVTSGNGHKKLVSLALSADGERFTKPALRQMAVYDHGTNNSLIAGLAGAGVGNVWRDPRRGFNATYVTQSYIPLDFFGSDDGLVWRAKRSLKLPPCEGAIAGYDTQPTAFYDERSGEYFLYARRKQVPPNAGACVKDSSKCQFRVRSLRFLRSESLNGDWTAAKDPATGHELVPLQPDAEDNSTHAALPCAKGYCAPTMDYYGGTVWTYPLAGNNSYYFMLTERFWHWMGPKQGWSEPDDAGPATIDIGLAFSTDGVRFTHLGEREAFIGLGREGSFDSRMVWGIPSPVVMEEHGEIWFYFSGVNRDHSGRLDPSAPSLNATEDVGCIRAPLDSELYPPGGGPLPEDKVGCSLTGIGLAKLPIDRFVSLHAPLHPAGPAVAVTRPLIFEGRLLLLNVDATGGGSVHIELLDCATDAPTAEAAHVLASSVPVNGDALNKTVAWVKHTTVVYTDIGVLAGRPLCMRFSLVGADIFAFQFVKTDDDSHETVSKAVVNASLAVMAPVELYVSVGGESTGAYSSAQAVFGSVASAQAHVQRLIAANLRRRSCSPITVHLSGGLHELGPPGPLEINALSSGPSQACPVRWIGQRDAVNGPSKLSGGVKVQGWKRCKSPIEAKASVTCWEAPWMHEQLTPRTLRLGERPFTVARFPNKVGGNYSASFVTIASVTEKNTSAPKFHVTTNPFQGADSLSEATMANAFVWPERSWINVYFDVSDLSIDRQRSTASFTLTLSVPVCTGTHHLACTITPGNRLYFSNATSLLDAPFEWVHDRAAHSLRMMVPSTVDVATAEIAAGVRPAIVRLDNATNVEFIDITFTDSSWTALGVQRDWDTDDTTPGAPRDGALVISSSHNVTVRGSDFRCLGGGAIVLRHDSHDVMIDSNTATHVGQSGVQLVGNDVTQPHDVTITNNSITHIGEILVSAAGVFVTSGRRNYIARNRISDCPRWGIAVRSNAGKASDGTEVDAASPFNVVEFNTVQRTGLETRDFGAISVIDHSNHTGRVFGTVIRGNCVKDAIGVDTDIHGNFLSPYYSWGIYLDDHTSNCVVERNIVRDTDYSGVFVHGGINNTISNNILMESGREQAPIKLSRLSNAGGSLNCTGNSFSKNVVLTHTAGCRTHCIDTQQCAAGDWPAGMPCSNNSLSCKALVERGGRVTRTGAHVAPCPVKEMDKQLYFDTGGLKLASWPNAFDGKDWAGWQAMGMDRGSLVDVDPGFANLDAGDFRLAAGSPLKGLGFEGLAQQC